MVKPHLNIPRVDFMVPGFSKCGTTSLCYLLSEHPDIFIPKKKESNFFVSEGYCDNWDSYRGFFKDAANQKMLGEGGTFYTGAVSEVKARSAILQHYPNIKLVFIARDPLDRLESSFREFHHSGAKYGLETPISFDETLRTIPNLLDDTRYWSRLNNFLKYMEVENIHVLFLEDLMTDADAELRKCFQFLGVNDDFPLGKKPPQLNRASSKYYDSNLLRYLRRNILLATTLRRLGIERQNKIAKAIGLRKKFSGPIEWQESTVTTVVTELADEVHQFLDYASKPCDYWPRFTHAVNQCGHR